MKKANYLLFFLFVVIIAFWQVFFLQNGMKWDFTDAFLPSRYFFSESVLNNQFPFWNPYLLYGTPIYADLVSVFNPEFWIIANLFAYSNITLQYVFLGYIFVAGLSFFYFLKQFDATGKPAAGFAVAYMLSGFAIGNAQHIAFVSGYALIPFLMAGYFRFIRQLNRASLVQFLIASFLMIYCSYPALTIISGYFIFLVFFYCLLVNRANKTYLKKLIIRHLMLILVVVLFSITLLLAYFQVLPFLDRFKGLPIELALKHPFSLKSLLSFLLPMATGNDPQYFGTDISFSNGYWGIVSLVLFLFLLTKKGGSRESFIILIFGIFSLSASFGDQFFVRSLLYKYLPLMDKFQYPGIFRAFAIFSFLAFTGINFKTENLHASDKKRLILIAGSILLLLIFLVFRALRQTGQFLYWHSDAKFSEILFQATRFDNMALQGIIQSALLFILILLVWRIKQSGWLSSVLLLLMVADGVISTQLSTHYTVLSNTNPVAFYKYLKSSPKGFPVPGLNPIGENSDRNAASPFTWINNNVFPKKVTFDGLVSFKTDGYMHLSDKHPGLLEAIKKEPLLYFSGDARIDSAISDYQTNTVFLSPADFKKPASSHFQPANDNKLEIVHFAPAKIEIKTTTSTPQLLVYQQNYFTGWGAELDGAPTEIFKVNFTHMAVLVPPGNHTIVFQYKNNAILVSFAFTLLLFLVLIFLSVYFYIAGNPAKKRKIIILLISLATLFLIISQLNRYFYQMNKLGLAPVIVEKTGEWKTQYGAGLRTLLSTQQKDLIGKVNADATCYINEQNNVAELTGFLTDAESEYFAFAWQGSIIGDELFELIASFYPEMVEQKKNNNSGVVLFKKSTESVNYDITKDFEPDSTPEWEQMAARTVLDETGENHVYAYGENDQFGFTVDILAGKEWVSGRKITLLADFKIEPPLKEVLLVFTTERNGKLQVYQTLAIDRFAKHPGKWSRAVFEFKNLSEIQEGDLIRVYIWNKNNAVVQVDNLRVKLHKQ